MQAISFRPQTEAMLKAQQQNDSHDITNASHHLDLQLPIVDDDFHTLPLEIYDPYLNVEDPDKLLAAHRNRDGRVYGRSRWFYPDGTSEFRDCEIMNYDPEEHRYVVKWTANGIIKKVARFNLRVEDENTEVLAHRVEAAIKNRTIAEKIIECNLIIDNLKLEGRKPVPEKVKCQIMYFIRTEQHLKNPYIKTLLKLVLPGGEMENLKRSRVPVPAFSLPEEIKLVLGGKYSRDFLNALIEEADLDYMRVYKIIDFQNQLPYKGDYYERFREGNKKKRENLFFVI